MDNQTCDEKKKNFTIHLIIIIFYNILIKFKGKIIR